MLPSKWFTLAIGLPQIVDFLPPVSSPRQARDDDRVAGTETTRGWSWAVVGCLANVIGKTWENIGQNIGENIWISINGGSQNGWLMEKLGGYPHFRDPPIIARKVLYTERCERSDFMTYSSKAALLREPGTAQPHCLQSSQTTLSTMRVWSTTTGVIALERPPEGPPVRI